MQQRTGIGAAILITMAVIACQTPTPTTPPSVVPTSPAPSASTAVASAGPTRTTATGSPTPAPPMTDEAWDAMLTGTAEDLAAALIGLYDGIEPEVLDRWFTPEGLESALAHDRQLRDARRGEGVIDGTVTLRAWSTVVEDRAADPPRLELALAFVVEPPSSLVDPRTGLVSERFDHRRYFGTTYALRYDAVTERWLVSAAAPISEGGVTVAPPPLDPLVRCPGLDPAASSQHPVATIVWCFGGEEGTLASVEQVASFEGVPCGGTSARVLSTGWPIGSTRDVGATVDFVQDPKGEFDAMWPLPLAFDDDAALPDDAYSTGLTDGRYEVWVSPEAGASAVWMHDADRFERWPAAGPWGVTDCN